MGNEESNKPRNSESRGDYRGGKGNGGRSGGYKGGSGSGKKFGGSKGGDKKRFGDKPAWKKDKDSSGYRGKSDGAGNEGKRYSSDSRDGYKGGKPAWKKDGNRSGKPAWKKDGERSEGKRDWKDKRDDRGYKGDRGGSDFKKKRFDNDDRRDFNGEKPAWKKDGEKRFNRDDRRDRKFDRDDKRERKFDRKNDERFEGKRDGFKKPFDKDVTDGGYKSREGRVSRTAERNAEGVVREKRGDRFIRKDATLASKKERDHAQLTREDDFVYSGDHVMSKKAQEGIFLEIGETVAHKTYGVGTVRKVTGGKAGVEFDGKYRWFAFPSCVANGVIKRMVDGQFPQDEEPEADQEIVADPEDATVEADASEMDTEVAEAQETSDQED